jgi:hypothetical protein
LLTTVPQATPEHVFEGGSGTQHLLSVRQISPLLHDEPQGMEMPHAVMLVSHTVDPHALASRPQQVPPSWQMSLPEQVPQGTRAWQLFVAYPQL